MTWCTVWINTLERRPGGGAHATFFGCMQTVRQLFPQLHTTIHLSIYLSEILLHYITTYIAKSWNANFNYQVTARKASQKKKKQEKKSMFADTIQQYRDAGVRISSCSYKVSPADLTDLHVIRYELERDLMPLVLSNTQYSIERGQETLHEYDLPNIQQQIVSRFLLGKPLITLNVSKFCQKNNLFIFSL